MKTRKQRKWYQMKGMLRAGKIKSILDIPFVIYYAHPLLTELQTIASGNYLVLIKNGFAVDKETAKITGNYDPRRLYVWAGIDPLEAENARQQLNEKLYKPAPTNFIPTRLNTDCVLKQPMKEKQ